MGSAWAYVNTSSYTIVTQNRTFWSISGDFWKLKTLQTSMFTGIKNGRRDRIRTCGVLLPKQALYQTELLSERVLYTT